MKNILVIGDCCKDEFIYGKCTRINPEAPTPVFVPNGDVKSNSGMSGNVIANLKSLSPEDKIFYYISDPSSSIKTRYVDLSSNYIILRVDKASTFIKFDESYFKNLLNETKFDCVIISDYDKGFLTISDIEFISHCCSMNKIPTFLDTKKALGVWSNGITCIKINESEYIHSAKNSEVSRELWTKFHLVVTKGSNGCQRYYGGQCIEKFEQEPVEVRDVSGAGDTFLAALALEYIHSEDGDIQKACKYANKCARVAVSKRGVVAVSKDEVL